MRRKHHDVFFYSGFRVQGSGFRVQGSGGGFAAFLEEGILDTQPSPLGEGAPKGRIGYWRYERERGGSSQVGDIREHPIHRCAVPLPQWGRLRNEDAAIPDTQPSPLGEGAPKGRIGHWRYERERGGSSQVGDIREHPIHRCAVPLPQWGRLRNEDAAIPDTLPSPRGEGAPKGRIGYWRYER